MSINGVISGIVGSIVGVIVGALLDYFLHRWREKDLSRKGLRASIISLINDLEIFKDKWDSGTIRSIIRTNEMLRHYAVAAMMSGVIKPKDFEELIRVSISSTEVVFTEGFVINQVEAIRKKLYEIENKLRDC